MVKTIPPQFPDILNLKLEKTEEHINIEEAGTSEF